MAKVISVLNSKGGTAKTTTAVHLARALQLAGSSVVLLDADTQGSALAWSALGALSPALRVEPVKPKEPGQPGKGLAGKIAGLAPAPDYVVIDGAAKLEVQHIGEALRVSDLVLIPVQPSPVDLWAAAVLVDAVKMRLEVAGRPHGAFVVARQVIGSALADGVQDALEAAGLPVLSARLSQRVAYVEALAAGVTVLEHEPAGKAAAEVRALLDEVLTIL